MVVWAIFENLHWGFVSLARRLFRGYFGGMFERFGSIAWVCFGDEMNFTARFVFLYRYHLVLVVSIRVHKSEDFETDFRVSLSLCQKLRLLFIVRLPTS